MSKLGPNGGVIDIDDPYERGIPCGRCGQPVTAIVPGQRTFRSAQHHDGATCIRALGLAVKALQQEAQDG